jgi:hypothetical protein
MAKNQIMLVITAMPHSLRNVSTQFASLACARKTATMKIRQDQAAQPSAPVVAPQTSERPTGPQSGTPNGRGSRFAIAEWHPSDDQLANQTGCLDAPCPIP